MQVFSILCVLDVLLLMLRLSSPVSIYSPVLIYSIIIVRVKLFRVFFHHSMLICLNLEYRLRRSNCAACKRPAALNYFSLFLHFLLPLCSVWGYAFVINFLHFSVFSDSLLRRDSIALFLFFLWKLDFFTQNRFLLRKERNFVKNSAS